MTYEKITSVKNPLAQMLRHLKDKRERESEGMFLVEGEKMLGEALKCGLRPKYLFCDETKIGSVPQMFSDADVITYEVTDSVLKSVSDTVTPAGCVCAFSMPKPLDDDIYLWPDIIVALDGVQDPGNVGTIWRTADAAGFKAIIVGDGCADMTSPKVQRSAMGSGFRLPYFQDKDLAKRLEALKKSGYDIIATSLEGEAFYSCGPISGKFVLVIGSEARGISKEVYAQATKRLKLPMRGGAESLNAAVAAGIMMYELTRQLSV